MESREEHLSPDGWLRLVVTREHGDTTVRFDGFPWHTHGDVLAGRYELAGRLGLSPEDATRLFVDELIHGRAVIAFVRVDDVIKDVWVTDDMGTELEYQQDGEELVFRRWDGTLCGVS
jgi:hypothetical protein